MMQNSIVTRLNMLYGAADLMMLVLLAWILQADETTHWRWGILAGLLVGLSSALPFWLPVIGYVILVALVTLAQRKVWQVPIWLLLISAFVGSFLIYGLEFSYLLITGVPLDLVEVINSVILPSLVLNMILVLPVYGLVGELAKLVYPKEVEV
jgi:cell shape-determining protein MreD